MPGARVPGLAARYVWTGLGWLGPDDDVVFEAIIRWDLEDALGCGILRADSDGRVNTVLMQDQPLPGTGGGVVKHPRLPVEASGDTLLIPAMIVGGAYERGLFAVPKGGGEPALLVGATGADFGRAFLAPDGAAIVERVGLSSVSVLLVEEPGNPRVLLDGCAPGVDSDGAIAVARRSGGAWMVGRDGVATALLLPGDPAPGASGRIVDVRAAWITADGAPVVLAGTDDPARREVLARFGIGPGTVAVSGEPAPETAGSFASLSPAAGRSADVVFGAAVAGDPAVSAALFRAPAGAVPAIFAASGEPAADLDGVLAIEPQAAVASDSGRAAFLARVFEDGVDAGQAVFARGGSGPLARVLALGAPIEAIPDATIAAFLYPVRDAIRVAPDGRVLVHVGIRLDRQPSATYGALLLARP